MEVVILGTGNVGQVLGTLIKNAGHRIVQVYGRTPDKATQLASELGSAPACSFSAIAKDAQLYLVALADTATAALHENWHTNKGLVVHTAGSVPLEVLKDVSNNYGVLYPLQSLRAPHIPEAGIPLLVDANTPDDLALLTDFAGTISPVVRHCSDEDRLHLHLSAVLVNNFTNHLYKLAEEYCHQHGLHFELLYPLILETANRATRISPSEAQTGPANRNDMNTINRHLEQLKSNPPLAALYQMLSASIQGS
jgi:predicted short-subunit dehydrogenase-like oxidoreductase (DUF2520 family)